MRTVFVLLMMIAVPDGYHQSFDEPDSLDKFAFSDPSAWRSGDGSLDLIRQSRYKPPHRSPVNIALLADRRYGSFTLEADMMQTGDEYGHRDMCLFFNFVDPAHYYYIHIATETDAHAHNIFIVNGEARKKISTTTTAGHDWGSDEWHRVKVVRDTESGSIEVRVNGETIMTANDKTFTRGYLGFGSFDDTGRVDNIRVRGVPADTKPIDFFRPR